MIRRRVVWFSCGAASAAAAKLTVDTHGWSQTVVVYCDTMATEHPDNQRFFDDVSRWIGGPIQRICSQKYVTVDDVFERTRYMAGIGGARCTVEMKKVPRFMFQRPDDIHIFGLTVDEWPRIQRFRLNNHDLDLEWPLCERVLTKEDCKRMLVGDGITLPAMYGLGFRNNNCLGCVKATSARYWDATREHFPETFARRARQSRELGVRLARYKGKRIYLDELPVGATGGESESVSCGPDCGDTP